MCVYMLVYIVIFDKSDDFVLLLRLNQLNYYFKAVCMQQNEIKFNVFLILISFLYNYLLLIFVARYITRLKSIYYFIQIFFISKNIIIIIIDIKII